MFNGRFNSCGVAQNTNYSSDLMLLCVFAIKKKLSKLPLTCQAEGTLPVSPLLCFTPPSWGFLTTAFRKAQVSPAIFSTFRFLRRQAGSQRRDLEAFPANCQLVNLIGLSPWAPFLNQLGSELAVTSFSQAGCLEAHHPGEVRHPNGKMLTSAAESYHIFKFILYNYCKISSRKKAELCLFLPPSLLLCSPLCKNTLFSITSWLPVLPLFSVCLTTVWISLLLFPTSVGFRSQLFKE